jgi:membrane fusion protein, copper/silver efflux system
MTRTAILFGLAVAGVVGAVGCGAEPQRTEHAGAASAPQQLWTCGMHPQVIQDHPGNCPICGMALTPMRDDAGHDQHGIVIDPVIRQNMGVRTAAAVEAPLRITVRAVGYLAEAQPSQHDVTLRVSGYIEKLHAGVEGMHVTAGQPLFDLYSPELEAAIGEFIGARRARASGAGDGLYEAARRKLRLLGLTEAQVDRLAQLDRPPPAVTFTSPVTGHVVTKNVVDGSAVQAGMQVMRIVDHRELWLDAQVFEQQLPLVRVGQDATATVAALPGRDFRGSVAFVHPHVDERTRAAMVRLVVPNPALELRPGMYATVTLESEAAPSAILVPREAVIDTGTRQLVFLAREGGRFDARNVRLGIPAGGGMVQIVDGLAPGDTVVVSGQFLLDAESRLEEAIRKHREHAAPAVR